MKKLMLVLFLLVSAKGFGQPLLKRLEFGLKAGVNYSNFTNADFPTDPLISFHAGVIVAFKITNNFLIQEDFLFSTQGAKNKSTLLENKDIKLYYVSVPLLLKFRTNSGFYIEAGPQVGIKAGEKVEGVTTSDFAKKLDLGVVGGIGFQTKLGLGIGARYIYGLSKVSDFSISNVHNDFYNNNAQVSVFFVF